jgi:hypothetical protein
MINNDEVIQSFNILRTSGDIAEIRILNTKQGTISGYFNDPEKMSNALIPYCGKHNIYITLNPVKPELFARSANKLTPFSKTTTADRDILQLEFLMLDFDPNRSSGIASTEDEHDAAKQKAMDVRSYLQQKGFPDPLLCDSGNGFHLLYYTNIPNNPDNVALMKKFIGAIDTIFSDDRVSVDRTTYNPSRITRFYGTLNVKGDNTVERPHRKSQLSEYPSELQPVPIEKLQEIAESLSEVTANVNESRQTTINAEQWLSDHGIEVAIQARWQDQGMKYILKRCPWNPEHQNRSAYVIQFDSGAIVAGCHHNSCSGENWQSLKKKYEPDVEVSSAKGDEKSGHGEERESQADALIRLGETAEYFTNDLQEPYAAVSHASHTEVIPVKSGRFKLYLTKLFFEEKTTAPSSESLQKALNVLEMKAIFSDCERTLQRRVAQHEGDFYYDLADSLWQAVKISAGQTGIDKQPPILFTRAKNTKTQVAPDFTSTPQSLPALLNKHFRLKDHNGYTLLAVYLVSCYIPSIFHPILVLHGEKGSSKSTAMRMIKSLVDPAIQDLLSMPTSKQDMVLILANNYMPCFDNLDSLSIDKSDLLCMAATGGAFSKRTLYSDADETILRFLRCVVLNGISLVATRPDLLDRSILQELERIPRDERKTEAEVWRTFEEDKAKILGSIFNTLAQAMKVQPSLHLTQTGRMADFTVWGYAIAEAMGIGGDAFLKVYLGNQEAANDEALSSHPVAAAVMALLANCPSWSGSVSTLLTELERIAERERINTRIKTWPAEASVLSKRLKEIKSNLEEIGIYYEIRHTGKCKKIQIEKRNANVDDNKISTFRVLKSSSKANQSIFLED